VNFFVFKARTKFHTGDHFDPEFLSKLQGIP
jgi:hypothetical protein